MTLPALPDAMKRWMRSANDPWIDCERADWLIYVAHARDVKARTLIAALARCLPRAEVPPELLDVAKTIDDLVTVLASLMDVSDALADEVRTRLVPQVSDWNHGRSYGVLARSGAETPDGFPLPPSAEVEPLRTRANAVLRLKRAGELHQRGDEQWYALLALVALHIVFQQLGGGSPLYNHVEMEELSSDEVAAHERVCRELRTELDALMPAQP